MVASLLYFRVLSEKTIALVFGEPNIPGNKVPKWKFCLVTWQYIVGWGGEALSPKQDFGRARA